MRTVRLVEGVSELGTDIRTILEYLALNGEHFVTFVLRDPLGEILVYNHLSMKDDGSVVSKVMLKGEEEPEESSVVEPTLLMFKGVIAYSKEIPPSEKFKDTFSSKWDEIVGVTGLNVSFNRWRQADIM